MVSRSPPVPEQIAAAAAVEARERARTPLLGRTVRSKGVPVLAEQVVERLAEQARFPWVRRRRRLGETLEVSLGVVRAGDSLDRRRRRGAGEAPRRGLRLELAAVLGASGDASAIRAGHDVCTPVLPRSCRGRPQGYSGPRLERRDAGRAAWAHRSLVRGEVSAPVLTPTTTESSAARCAHRASALVPLRSSPVAPTPNEAPAPLGWSLSRRAGRGARAAPRPASGRGRRRSRRGSRATHRGSPHRSGPRRRPRRA
jgi:hypothetical protein